MAFGTAGSASPAAAGYGDALTAGQTVFAPAGAPVRTQLNYQASSGAVDNYFLVTDGSAGDGALFSSAIGGYAYTNVNTGIYGYSHQPGGNGVFGLADGDAASYGVWGRSPTGAGVVGQSTSGFDLAGYGGGRFYLIQHTGSGAPVAGTHSLGEMVRDSHGDWYVSYQAGTPGKWRKLGGGTTAGALHVITPARVYDSRFVGSGGRLQGGASRVVSVANSININTGAPVTANVVPDGATAIAYNITITGCTGSGFLAVTPGSALEYAASTINWGPGITTLANGTLVQLDPSRQVKVFAGGGSTEFVIDINGYYL